MKIEMQSFILKQVHLGIKNNFVMNWYRQINLKFGRQKRLHLNTNLFLKIHM